MSALIIPFLKDHHSLEGKKAKGNMFKQYFIKSKAFKSLFPRFVISQTSNLSAISKKKLYSAVVLIVIYLGSSSFVVVIIVRNLGHKIDKVLKFSIS